MGGTMPGAESHYVPGTAWLRAAVLGANDGIISTASLIMGVATAAGERAEILSAAVAGWAAGAMSMAAGEYVSVFSQADSEAADLTRERRALREQPVEEKEELTHICEERGLKPKLAEQIADQLMAKDALDAHARDDLAWTSAPSPNRSQAAFASALAFSLGEAAPTLTAFLAPQGAIVKAVPARRVGLSGRARRLGGRRADGEAGAQSRLLGRAGHGGDGGDRHHDRQGRLALPMQARRASLPFASDAGTDVAAPRRRTLA
jgi:vacuolar iron transporter family protein